MKKNHVLIGVVLYAALSLLLTGCPMDSEDDDNGDTVPPALSDGSVNADGVVFAGARLSFISSEAGTAYFIVLSDTAPAPNAKTIKAQGQAESKGSGKILEGENGLTAGGLSAGLPYTAYIAAEDAAGNLSAVLTLGGIVPTVQPLLAGSEWYFGNIAKLTFRDGSRVTIYGYVYDYTFDAATGTGHIVGDVSQGAHSFEGINNGDKINSLGDFTLDGPSITFSNYRNATFPVTFASRRTTSEKEPLLGTAWHWGVMVLEFLPNDKAIQYNVTGYYPHPHIYAYGNYDPSTRRGRIKTAERVCDYSQSTTGLGWFEIKADFPIEDHTVVDFDLYFASYKEYGHRADFVKWHDEYAWPTYYDDYLSSYYP
jgi:hypothetical protein